MKNYIYDLIPSPMKYLLNTFFVFCLLFAGDTADAQCSPDTTPPVAICDLGLVANLNAQGELTIWAQDFDDGSYDQCSTVDYFLEEASAPSQNPPSTQSLFYDTDDIGLHDIVLWVVDTASNWNNCFTQLEINPCGNPANPTCNNFVQIALPPSGEMDITPDMILEGGPYCNPMTIGFTPPGNSTLFVDTTDIGQHTVTVTDAVTGNTCWGTVDIQYFFGGGCPGDMIPPTCIAPANTSISFEAYEVLNIDPNNHNDLATYFGAADAADNCGVMDILKSVELENNGQCGLRSITRSFVAVDSAGNQSATCVQVIDIYHEWSLHLPADYDPNDPFIDSVEIVGAGGGIIGIAFEDLVFDFNCDEVADKIVRRWTVLNWCDIGNNIELLDLPSLDIDGNGETGDGYNLIVVQDTAYLLENGNPTDNLGPYANGFTYVQIIELNNNDTLSYSISGTVFHDGDEDCQFGNSEPVLEGWPVSATGLVTGRTYTTSTDTLGEYSFDLCTADTLVEISLNVPFNYGQTCPTTYTVQFDPLLSQSIVQDIPVHFDTECPILWVDISAPFLRRCFENYYTVSYCNYSNDTIENAYVEVQLDPFMSFTSSGLASTDLGGNLYSFDLGDLIAGDCGDFKIYFDLDCEAELGATHCVEAHIFPDTLCPPLTIWTGANIEVEGVCENDTIFLRIINTGQGAMVAPLNYIVVEDVIMYMDEPFQLAPGEDFDLNPIVANGATWRLEAPQEPGHPYEGKVAVAVEGCGGINIFGLVNLFSVENPNPFIAVDCQQNIGSFDPNDKLAFPIGYDDAHYIERNTDIDYLIRFQNTGTDTAFNVYIIDEIDPSLDLSSIRPGASSHPYQFELVNGNTVRISFNDILLPDSTTNELESHGFIKFKVSQKENLPLGTVIENDAAIYFDFNDPVITNTVFHTIGEHFIEVVNDEEAVPAGFGDLSVYPNPSFGVVTFTLPIEKEIAATFTLHNTLGENVLVEKFANKIFQFNKSDLTGGIYFYSIEVEGVGVYTGKIILK